MIKELEDLYYKIYNEIPKIFKDKNISFKKSSLFKLKYDINKNNIKKILKINSNDKEKENKFILTISGIILSDFFYLDKNKINISYNNLIDKKNIKDVEFYFKNHLNIENFFIDRVLLSFINKDVLIYFKIEDVYRYRTKIMKLRITEDGLIYNENKKFNKDLFISSIKKIEAELMLNKVINY